MAWLYLAAAICCEVLATLALRARAGGGRPGLVAVIVVGYALSFSSLAFALRSISVGAAYAIWSAVGTAAVAGLGVVLFGERLNAASVAGMALIVFGVILLVRSGAARHR